jgi:hypothetical protein
MVFGNYNYKLTFLFISIFVEYTITIKNNISTGKRCNRRIIYFIERLMAEYRFLSAGGSALIVTTNS